MKARDPHDYYPTPAWCVDRLLDRVAMRLPHRCASWLEPCAGSDAIVDAVGAWYSAHDPASHIEWARRDLHPQADGIERSDYLWFHGIEASGFDVAITNPPYREAHPFFEAMRRDARIVIALLRLGFAASEERREFLNASRPSIYVLPNRPSFTIDGRTDASDYAWFVWGLDDRPEVRWLETTPAAERRVRRPA